jgi:hypothetical protein
VLIPALEIEPDWLLPNGLRLSDNLKDCLRHDLQVLDLNITAAI